jgi:hypothetical protein
MVDVHPHKVSLEEAIVHDSFSPLLHRGNSFELSILHLFVE